MFLDVNNRGFEGHGCILTVLQDGRPLRTYTSEPIFCTFRAAERASAFHAHIEHVADLVAGLSGQPAIAFEPDRVNESLSAWDRILGASEKAEMKRPKLSIVKTNSGTLFGMPEV